jgi:hypothetical protein
LGVIDTLSAGFGLINRRLWLILLPIALDLFLWYGPRLSIAPVAQDALRTFNRSLAETADQPLPVSRPSEETVKESEAGMALYLDSLGRSNFIALHSVQGANFAQVPTLSGGLEWLDILLHEDVYARASGDREAAFQLTNLPALLGVSFVLTLAFLFLGSLYYLALALATQGPEPKVRYGPAGFVGRVFMGWLRLIGYFALLGLVLALILTPATIAVLAVAIFSPELAALVLTFVSSALVAWPLMFLFFGVPAMFASDVDPVRGIWYSYKVVQLNFGSAVRFIAAVLVLSFGMPMAWRLVVQLPLAGPLGILSNAYIATGIAAGGILFYRERFQSWQASAVRRPHVIHQ